MIWAVWAGVALIAGGILAMIRINTYLRADGTPAPARMRPARAREFMRREPDMLLDDFPLPGRVGQRGDVGLWIKDDDLYWCAYTARKAGQP